MFETKATINTDEINVKTLIYSADGTQLNPDVQIGKPDLEYMGAAVVTEEGTEENDNLEGDVEAVTSEDEEEIVVEQEVDLAEQLEQKDGLETEVVTEDEFTTYIADEETEVAQAE